VDAPEVWNRVATEENQGNIDLIDKELRAAVPDATKTEYACAKIASLAAANQTREEGKAVIQCRGSCPEWMREAWRTFSHRWWRGIVRNSLLFRALAILANG
jgi:hypothetical protein